MWKLILEAFWDLLFLAVSDAWPIVRPHAMEALMTFLGSIDRNVGNINLGRGQFQNVVVEVVRHLISKATFTVATGQAF